MLVQAPATAAQQPGALAASVPSSYHDYITMQAQQKNQWCWAASGNTIAAYWNYSVSQNDFCAYAKNRSTSYDCPNWQGTLDDVQNAFSQLGFSYTGDYVWNTVSFGTVQNQVSANQPLETRIQWNSGGGHMHVLYGYDANAGTVSYGDPWPSNQRYNTMSYNYYVSNGSFSWTHTLTGIRG
ncbi:papain-like cysteine protease family protein [Solihabitans fulvus]